MDRTTADSLCVLTRRRGFTLVELLVVISVVATLVAMLFPGIRAALWSSKTQTSRLTMAQVGMAIDLFRDMRGFYPEMESAAFCGPKLVEELGSLLKTRDTSFVDTDNDRKLDTVVDAWGRPFIYTRYVKDLTRAPNQNPGDSNGENGIQPIHNRTTYDLFSCGSFAEQVMVTKPYDAFQKNALTHTNGLSYTHDGEHVKAGGKPTADVNRYLGNW